MNCLKQYREAGLKADLDELTLIRYVKYMSSRWPSGIYVRGENEERGALDEHYAMEWAQRFKDRREYQMSDHEGRKVLDELTR